jgi:ABC-2 type transport system ATP-binding protein
MAVLTTTGLGKDYGAHTAVRSLDLEIPRGSIFGLLGPNGAGKTTAISMICGVVTPSRGCARVAGHDLRAAPFAARRALGYVPQELAIYEELSATQNLAFFGRCYGLRGPALTDRLSWALELAGLRGRHREPVSQFSGGMKRRLNLVAALMHRPQLLVLDEPTVGVDPQSRSFLFAAIRRLRDEGMTVLYTSHYMEEVEALCDRVAIIDRGEVIASDSVAGLLASGGGGGIEVELEGGEDELAEALEALPAASRVASGLRVESPAALAEAIGVLEAGGLSISALRSVAPDLEQVFLQLTGHRLRDDP